MFIINDQKLNQIEICFGGLSFFKGSIQGLIYEVSIKGTLGQHIGAFLNPCYSHSNPQNIVPNDFYLMPFSNELLHQLRVQ